MARPAGSGDLLRSHSYTLAMSLSDTSVLSITQSLLSAGVLNRHECDAVHAKATPLEKVSALTATMMRKGPSAYPNFYGALEECDPALYEQLTGIKARRPQIHPQTPATTTAPSDSTVTYISIYDSTITNSIVGNDNELHLPTTSYPVAREEG
ncbi:baculoviral IAP repeat-containing protein 3-like isoform X3 [Lampetra fluviatilis]